MSSLTSDMYLRDRFTLRERIGAGVSVQHNRSGHGTILDITGWR